MITATAGVNGRMGKKDDAKEKDAREAKLQEAKGAKKGTKPGPSFLDDNPTLRNTLAQIEKEFGDGSIMPLGAERQAPIDLLVWWDAAGAVAASSGRYALAHLTGADSPESA